MNSKKKMWSGLHLLADTAVMVCENEERFARKEKGKIIYVEDDDEESAKKLFTRRSYLQQHYRNLNVSSSSMKFGYLKSPLVESDGSSSNPNGSSSNPNGSSSNPNGSSSNPNGSSSNPNGSSSIMNLGYLKSPLVESGGSSSNPNGPSSIMNLGYLKSPFVESGGSSSNPNGSSSIMNLGYLKSPLVESEKTKDPPNPNDDKSSSPSDPPYPNEDKSSSPSSCLTENTSRKRRVQKQKQRKSKGGFNFKRAKNSPLPFVERKIPNWVFQVMRNINGDVENPRMLFERTLTESDVKSSQSRLLIPFSMVITKDFLTPDEARAMNKEVNKQEDENVGVGTIVVNEESKMWGLRLKIWQMEKKNSGKGTLNYALNWGWNDVVEGNHLKANDKIRLWAFRCRGVLCFALDLLERV